MSNKEATNSNSENASNKTNKLLLDLHFKYLSTLEQTKDKDSIGFFTNEHLKMGALFWGIGALNLIHKLDTHNKEKTLDFITKCYQSNGGFSGSIGLDTHITTTQYALLILLQLDSLNTIVKSEEDKDKIASYVKSLQNKDGSFKGDEYTESDSRFSYSAVSILKILNRLNKDYIDLNKATEFVLSCQNFDGGFGSLPGAESHGAYCFCCIGFLSVTGQLHLLDKTRTGTWLCERQTHLGGFNGRPEKLPDVCYSWWVLSSISMIGFENFDKDLLAKFILECQDSEEGGIGDRPGNCQDVFHTFFGLCGLSLMGYGELREIDATYAVPKDDVKKFIIKEN